MPDRTKRSTLTREAIRSPRTPSLSVPWNSYVENYGATIIRLALEAWNRTLEDDRTGVNPLYMDKDTENNKEQKKRKRKRASSLGD